MRCRGISMLWGKAKVKAKAVRGTANASIVAVMSIFRVNVTLGIFRGTKLPWDTITKFSKPANTPRETKGAKRDQLVPRVVASKEVANHSNLGPNGKATLGANHSEERAKG